MTFKIMAALVVSCAGLAACASTGPGSANANSPAQAPSGVTSSNGGGQRQLGNIPSVGITTGPSGVSGTTVGAVPNSKGASY